MLECQEVEIQDCFAGDGVIEGWKAYSISCARVLSAFIKNLLIGSNFSQRSHLHDHRHDCQHATAARQLFDVDLIVPSQQALATL